MYTGTGVGIMAFWVVALVWAAGQLEPKHRLEEEDADSRMASCFEEE